jgi:hypothetical protein
MRHRKVIASARTSPAGFPCGGPPPVFGHLEIAGPEEYCLDELAAGLMAARGELREVVTYPPGPLLRCGARQTGAAVRPHRACGPRHARAVARSTEGRPDIQWVEANGRPAVLVSSGGNAVALLPVDVPTEGIDRIMWVMNQDKPSPCVASLGNCPTVESSLRPPPGRRHRKDDSPVIQ